MNITIAQADHAVTYTATTEPQLRRLLKRLTPTIRRNGDWITEIGADGATCSYLSEEGEQSFELLWSLEGLWDRLPLATRREIVAYARGQVCRRRRPRFAVVDGVAGRTRGGAR